MGNVGGRFVFTSTSFVSRARAGGRAIGALLLLSLAGASGQGSNTGRVDVQALVDLADPGATVVVPSGSYARVVLTKPLTLMGATPRPTFGHVLLAGPGTGELTLANLRVASPTGGSAPVDGAGFSEIHVSDCDITGFLRLKGARCLTVSRSTLAQSGTVGPFIQARGATTSLLDVTFAPFSPPMPNPDPDVITARLGLMRTSIPGYVDVKRVRTFADDLVLGGTPHPGGTLDLAWTTPAPSVVVLVSTGVSQPVERASGVWFLAQGAQIVGVEVSPGGMTLPIPPDAHLLGQRVAFQLYDWVPPQSLSRPVVTVIH